jgi:hypothetical protein
MAIDPREIFRDYVDAPYQAWLQDETCEWKALAVASGLNALAEHVFRGLNPNRQIGTADYQRDLGEFRGNLFSQLDHEHIRFVVEVFKHVEKRDAAAVPRRLDEKATKEAGAFSKEWSREFDVVRPQIGFPYGDGHRTEWVPLRQPVTRLIEGWKKELAI